MIFWLSIIKMFKYVKLFLETPPKYPQSRRPDLLDINHIKNTHAMNEKKRIA